MGLESASSIPSLHRSIPYSPSISCCTPRICLVACSSRSLACLFAANASNSILRCERTPGPKKGQAASSLGRLVLRAGNTRLAERRDVAAADAAVDLEVCARRSWDERESGRRGAREQDEPVPVMKELSSEARKRAALACSTASPKRPCKCRPRDQREKGKQAQTTNAPSGCAPSCAPSSPACPGTT